MTAARLECPPSSTALSLPPDGSLERALLKAGFEPATPGTALAWTAAKMLVPAVVVVAALAAPNPSPSSMPAYLVPVDESVLGEEFSAAQVETTLRERLGRRAAFRLVDEWDRGGVRVQVTGCARVEWSAVKREREPHPPVTLPPGAKPRRTLIRDEAYGVSVENRTLVVLSVRVVWQDEVRDLVSGELDQTLEAAVSTVARELEKLVKRKQRRSGH